MNYFENDFLNTLIKFFVNIATNLDVYIEKILWILLIYIILRILWFFLTRLRITIKYEKKTQFIGS